MKKLLVLLAASALFTLPVYAAPHAKQATDKYLQNPLSRHKANAVAFYDLAFNQHQLDEAVSRYIGKTYTQHNPNVADGGQAFIDVFSPFLKQHPLSHAQIKQVIAEGDLVVLHV